MRAQRVEFRKGTHFPRIRLLLPRSRLACKRVGWWYVSSFECESVLSDVSVAAVEDARQEEAHDRSFSVTLEAV